MSDTRVRFAPSPTGNLHVGGARTALFNWLFARSQGGKFILRIEDTDAERSKKEFEEEILASMKWLGLDWDEGPYYQSQRKEIYRSYARKLLDRGLAYEEEGPKGGKAVIYRNPKDPVEFKDLIRGKIRFEPESQKDIVLLKSDGTAAYNFAVVVDDAEMKISHVIRGEDHISNTPKQIPLYKALGFEVPEFVHIPLIVGMDRARLSKRTGATAVSDYREDGFLAPAMVNFLALLGWSPFAEGRGDAAGRHSKPLAGDKSRGSRHPEPREGICAEGDKFAELFSIDRAIELFDLSAVNKTAAAFDMRKLEWMNNQYIRKMPAGELLERVRPYWEAAGLLKPAPAEEHLLQLVGLLGERAHRIEDMVPTAGIFLSDEIKYDAKAVEKRLSDPAAFELLRELAARLEALGDFSAEGVEGVCRSLIEEKEIPGGALIHPVRVAVSGQAAGPSLWEMLAILGKEKTVRRLRDAENAVGTSRDFEGA
ncbi:MAG: glutamate--tRNA ligase [Candidatus Omnitrophica bacterium]|nr:glutamate--tRNA ligase [Candidatus Omnitrophota bacterium]